MFMLCVHIKIQKPSSNGSLVIDINNTKAKYK
jgi:hypothetical protein